MDSNQVASGEADKGVGTLSIGEVLAGLEEEFPDITVSKIRFLEAQGLLDPERTPSGYRQFSGGDVVRLRWILRQQREHFLPLKVIRQLLDEAGGEIPDGPEEGDPAEVEPFRERARRGPLVGSVSVSREELAQAVGVDPSVVEELERMGLVVGHQAGSATVFDDDALLVAKLASRFLVLGFDLRPLRMYLVAAQREAGVFEQVLLPRLRDDQKTRAAVQGQLDELTEAGSRLRELMLRRSLGKLGRP